MSTIDLMNHLRLSQIEPILLDNRPAVTRSRKVGFRTYELNSRLPGPLGTLERIVLALRICRATRCKGVFLATNYHFEGNLCSLLVSLILRIQLVVGVADRFREPVDSVRLWRLVVGRKATSFRELLYSIVRRAAIRRAEACLVASRPVGVYVTSSLRSRRAVVIGRGVDEFWFRGEVKEKTHDGIYVGRLTGSKGADLLLDAWSRVLSRIPDARLLVIGSGPSLPQMRNWVNRMGLDQSVRLTGYVDDPLLIRDLLHASRIFILPSRAEGFSRAVSEAMACGLPCVITDLPELVELYGDAATFFRLGDSEDLSQQVVALLQSPSALEGLGEKGKAVVSRYQWSAVAERASSEMLRAFGLPEQNRRR